jgi:hypothetical protein
MIDRNQIITHQEAIVLAKGAQLRSAADRVRIAILNDELSSTKVGASYRLVRSDYERWLERALKEDRQDALEFMDIAEARAWLKDHKVPLAGDRLVLALSNGEIRGAVREGLRWFIPRSEFLLWAESLQQEVVTKYDGTITLTEAVRLAACEGFNATLARNYLTMGLIRGEFDDAYRDGASWRMTVEGFNKWINAALDATEQQQVEVVVPKPALPWGCLCWLGVPVLVWLFAVLLK